MMLRRLHILACAKARSCALGPFSVGYTMSISGHLRALIEFLRTTGMNDTIDTTRLTLLLNELRLPAIKHLWEKFTERSDKEGWPAARLLMALAEHEIAERDRRRIERHLGEAKLLPGKTLENYDFQAVPMISKAQVSALCAGDGWLDKGANLLLFGPPGGGKSHLGS